MKTRSHPRVASRMCSSLRRFPHIGRIAKVAETRTAGEGDVVQ